MQVDFCQRNYQLVSEISMFSATVNEVWEENKRFPESLSNVILNLSLFWVLLANSFPTMHVGNPNAWPPKAFAKPSIKTLPLSNSNLKPNNSMPETSGQVHHLPILHTHHLQLISYTIPTTISLSHIIMPTNHSSFPHNIDHYLTCWWCSSPGQLGTKILIISVPSLLMGSLFLAQLPFSSSVSCMEISVNGERALIGINSCSENEAVCTSRLFSSLAKKMFLGLLLHLWSAV